MMREVKNDGGELLIWTNVDPAFDADFNKWYDTEHMQERLSVPGFEWGIRWRTTQTDVRRYLAIYRTTSIDTFYSTAYRKAFENQTEWSLSNFDRMRDPLRIVGETSSSYGDGSIGGFASLLPVAAGQSMDADQITQMCAQAFDAEGVVAVHALHANAQLSTPLSAGIKKDNDPTILILIEATSENAAASAVRAVSEMWSIATDVSNTRPASFELMWGLGKP